MKSTQFLTAAVTAFGLVSQGLAQNNNNGGNNNNNVNAQGGNNNNNNQGNNNGGGNGGNDLLLLQANVQAASNSQGTPDVAAGQSNSNTDPANFINFCTGKTLTNGKQVTQGSCNGVVMGDIPSNNNMISSIVIFPAPNQDLEPNTAFDVSVQITNLVAGSFTDPINTYYSAPQELQGGNVVGHCHVTIQDLNNQIAPQQPPNPKNFAFFKGINDDGNGAGLLSATVTAGLPPGTYRICTMNSASNHQPVLMPVAQRGAQDDCTKFTVGQGNAGGNQGNAGGNQGNAGGNQGNAGGNQGNAGGNQGNAGGNQGNAGGNQGNAGGNQGNGGNGAAASTTAAAAATSAATGNGNGQANNGGQGGNGGAVATTSAAAAATTTAAAGGNGGRGGNRFGRGRFGRGRGRFVARDMIA